ncbi:MAG: S41 family peptidase [Mycobacteriales bacterium]
MADTYLRFPHLAGDLLTFTAQDDVWIAPAGGGRAYRVTFDATPVSNPRLSADGTLIAWTSSRDGGNEIFVVETDGGVSRRLTHWGTPDTRTIGWTADGRVLAASAVGQPSRDQMSAYAVPLDGGPAEPLPYGYLNEVAVAEHGGVLTSSSIFRPMAYWKRYRGGTAAKLWLDRDGSGTYARVLPDELASLESPMWVGADRIAFVSDIDGPAAVYSLALGAGPIPGPDALVRHGRSEADDFYARNATTDGTRVIYHAGGEIFVLGSLDGGAEPEPVDIALAGARSARVAAPAKAGEHLGQVAPSYDGRGSAVEARGTVSWVTHRKGPVRRLAHGSAVRRRIPTVAGRDGALAWVTDADGDDAIEVGHRDGGETRRLGAGRLGRVLELAASPDGMRFAVASHDGRLLVVDAADGAIREIDRSSETDVSGLAFSPDSRWLAWAHPVEDLSQIKMVDVTDAAATPIEATPVRFTDFSPAFSADGKHLAFLSVRSFDPVYDAVVFDLSFPNGCRPQLIPLAATTPSPFDPIRDGRSVATGEEDTLAEKAAARVEERTEDRAGPVTPPPTVVDVDGIQARVVPFPVPGAQYDALRPVKGGFTWLRSELVGELGDDLTSYEDDRPRPALERFDLAKAKVAELVRGLDRYAVSGDGTRIVVVDKGALRVVPAEHPVPPDEADKSDEVINVDLDRLRIVVDPTLEWRQAFDEAGRLMRDNFWRADMNGVDWAGVLARYRPLVDRLGSHDDLIDLLWETQGELGTSHAYARPRPRPAPRNQGLLGADLHRDGDRWIVDRVLPGEPSEPRARSPLSAPGVGVRAGDAILAIDGQPVDPEVGPGPLLADTAGKPVELRIATGRAEPAERDVVVVPLGDEHPLRYQDRVATCRARVHERSGGRLGYLHVPDMVSAGWAQLHRDLRAEVGKDGVVFDLRGNGGGHTSELVVEKLARTVVGWDTPRNFRPHTYPSHAPRGPVVTVTDEYAGSDGDIATAAIKARGVGPVVGTRTWGGVIGIDGRYSLVDGTTVTQPKFSFWLQGPGWGVENYGVDPDVEVFNAPHDIVAGADPQLDRAIDLALQRLAETPPVTPPELPAPRS